MSKVDRAQLWVDPLRSSSTCYIVCVCVGVWYVCMNVCMCVRAHALVNVCGYRCVPYTCGQKTTTPVACQSSDALHLLFEIRSDAGWEFQSQTVWLTTLSPRRCWDCRHSPPCLAF